MDENWTWDSVSTRVKVTPAVQQDITKHPHPALIPHLTEYYAQSLYQADGRDVNPFEEQKSGHREFRRSRLPCLRDMSVDGLDESVERTEDNSTSAPQNCN